MKVICSSKMWVDTFVVNTQRDGSCVVYSYRDGVPRSTEEVLLYGSKATYTNLDRFFNIHLNTYENIIVTRK